MEIIALMKHSLFCLIYIIKYLIYNVMYTVSKASHGSKLGVESKQF